MKHLGLTDEQQAIRRRCVTSSEAAMVLGHSPWGQAYDVWARKQPDAAPTAMSPAMEWGHRLESAILQRFADDHDVELSFPGTLVHGGGWLAATPDAMALVDNVPCCVQAKTSRVRGAEWGEEGSTDVPHWYWIQVQIEMYVTGCDVAYLVVLFGGSDYHEYKIPRSPAFLERNIPKLEAFYRDHLYSGIPPQIDPDHPGAVELLRQVYPTDDGSQVTVYGDDMREVELLAHNYEMIGAHIALLEKQQEQAKAALMVWLGPAETLIGSERVIKWKRTKDSSVLDQAAYIERLEGLSGLDRDLLDEQRAECIKVRPGSRRFTISKIKQAGGGKA